MIERRCHACQATDKLSRYRGSEEYYCNKHYLQMYAYGKTIEYTKKDKNTYLIDVDDNIVYIDIRNKNQEITCQCIVDLDDWNDYLKNHKWSREGISKKSKGYIVTVTSVNNTRKTLRIHRLITNTQDGSIVDHIDGDVLNNRRKNLRIVNNNQSGMNKGLQSNNKSGQKGVSFSKQKQKWCAAIGYYGNSIYLGCYERLEDAIKIRKDAEDKYFGEYNRREL